MFGIDQFTGIINPPDSCLLAVGAIQQIPVVKNGEIKIGNVMKVTMSCDHRVVDGAKGSAFLQTCTSRRRRSLAPGLFLLDPHPADSAPVVLDGA